MSRSLKNLRIIERATNSQDGFFRHFEKCHLQTDMKILEGDAGKPCELLEPSQKIRLYCSRHSLHREEKSEPIRECTKFATDNCVLINNFHERRLMETVMADLEDIWTEAASQKVELNFVNIARRHQWSAMAKLKELGELR